MSGQNERAEIDPRLLEFFPKVRQLLLDSDAAGLANMYSEYAVLSVINSVSEIVPGNTVAINGPKDGKSVRQQIEAQFADCFSKRSYLDVVRTDAGRFAISQQVDLMPPDPGDPADPKPGDLATWAGVSISTVINNVFAHGGVAFTQSTEVYQFDGTNWLFIADHSQIFQGSHGLERIGQSAQIVDLWRTDDEFKQTFRKDPKDTLMGLLGHLTPFQLNLIDNHEQNSPWEIDQIKEILPQATDLSW